MAKDLTKIIEWTSGNASYLMDDRKLVITLDVSEVAVADAPLSETGKTRRIASTHGFMVLPGPHGLKLNLNLTAPLKGAI